MIATKYSDFIKENAETVLTDIDNLVISFESINKKIDDHVNSIISPEGSEEKKSEVKYPEVGKVYNYEAKDGKVKSVTISGVTEEGGIICLEKDKDGKVTNQFTVGKDRVSKFTKEGEKPVQGQEEQFTAQKF